MIFHFAESERAIEFGPNAKVVSAVKARQRLITLLERLIERAEYSRELHALDWAKSQNLIEGRQHLERADFWRNVRIWLQSIELKESGENEQSDSNS